MVPHQPLIPLILSSGTSSIPRLSRHLHFNIVASTKQHLLQLCQSPILRSLKVSSNTVCHYFKLSPDVQHSMSDDEGFITAEDRNEYDLMREKLATQLQELAENSCSPSVNSLVPMLTMNPISNREWSEEYLASRGFTNDEARLQWVNCNAQIAWYAKYSPGKEKNPLPVNYPGQSRWELFRRSDEDWKYQSPQRIPSSDIFDRLVELADPYPFDFSENAAEKEWKLSSLWLQRVMGQYMTVVQTDKGKYRLILDAQIQAHLPACSLDWKQSRAQSLITILMRGPVVHSLSDNVYLKSTFFENFYPGKDRLHPRHEDRIRRMLLYPSHKSFVHGPGEEATPRRLDLYKHREDLGLHNQFSRSSHQPREHAPINMLTEKNLKIPQNFLDWFIEARHFVDDEGRIRAPLGPTNKQMAQVRNLTRKNMRLVDPQELFAFRFEKAENLDKIDSDLPTTEYSLEMLEEIPW